MFRRSNKWGPNVTLQMMRCDEALSAVLQDVEESTGAAPGDDPDSGDGGDGAVDRSPAGGGPTRTKDLRLAVRARRAIVSALMRSPALARISDTLGAVGSTWVTTHSNFRIVARFEWGAPSAVQPLRATRDFSGKPWYSFIRYENNDGGIAWGRLRVSLRSIGACRRNCVVLQRLRPVTSRAGCILISCNCVRLGWAFDSDTDDHPRTRAGRRCPNPPGGGRADGLPGPSRPPRPLCDAVNTASDGCGAAHDALPYKPVLSVDDARAEAGSLRVFVFLLLFGHERAQVRDYRDARERSFSTFHGYCPTSFSRPAKSVGANGSDSCTGKSPSVSWRSVAAPFAAAHLRPASACRTVNPKQHRNRHHLPAVFKERQRARCLQPSIVRLLHRGRVDLVRSTLCGQQPQRTHVNCTARNVRAYFLGRLVPRKCDMSGSGPLPNHIYNVASVLAGP